MRGWTGPDRGTAVCPKAGRSVSARPRDSVTMRHRTYCYAQPDRRRWQPVWAALALLTLMPWRWLPLRWRLNTPALGQAGAGADWHRGRRCVQLVHSRCCRWSRKIAGGACCGTAPGHHRRRFRPPPRSSGALPVNEIPREWMPCPGRHQGALAPERQRHLLIGRTDDRQPGLAPAAPATTGCHPRHRHCRRRRAACTAGCAGRV